MTFDWQNLLSLAIVLIAAVYVARQAWRQLASHGPTSVCTTCSACPKRTDNDPQIVPLALGQRDKRSA
jgi:hypothetical protein